jgi:predicted MFS family arabinose efflux permease
MDRALERRVVVLLASVQFVNILDFMMVAPLGPDFARSLSIPLSRLALVVVSYTLAAAATGVLGALLLDRFDRRSALVFALGGLALGTAGAAFATGIRTLVLARVVAGAFGGPATALALAILADVVPAERRGKALGTVSMAFAVSSVLGVPAGLWMASKGSWQTPFIATGALALVATFAAWRVLPPIRAHLDVARAPIMAGFQALFSRRATWLAYAANGLSMMGGFVLIPNIAGFLQANLHYDRDRLPTLYMAGGLVSLATLRMIGSLVDRFGSFRVGLLGTLGGSAVVWIGFVQERPMLPILIVFILFMFFSGLRNVSSSTLGTKVPTREERARFQSVQSIVQHVATSAGGGLSSLILTTSPEGRLVHIDRVAWTSIGLGLLVPPVIFALEREVRRAAEVEGSARLAERTVASG